MSNTSPAFEATALFPTSLEQISPEIATRYLATSKGNRRIHPGRVEAYVRDMQMHRWYIGETIKFDNGGGLIDGHHRLNAVIAYGSSVPMLVTRGLPPESIMGIDLGQSRNIAQISNFMGDEFSRRHFAVAKRIEFGFSNKYRSYNEGRDAVLKHLEAIEFVSAIAGKERFMNVSVLTVVVKAWYSKDHERLKEFLTVLKTGLATSERDWAAVRLREYLYRAKENQIAVDTPAVYLRVQSAVYHFCKGTPLRILRPATKDYFPTPDRAEMQQDPPEGC